MPASSAYPEDLREQVDLYLGSLEFSARPATEGLEEAMKYSLLAGGKRIRPVLALATARALGSDPAKVMPVAAALELIHTYSLIHDDLPAMDDDELRRGMPTSHVRFGENVAILAGDGLFAEAVSLVCARQEGDRSSVTAALGELMDAAGVEGMVGGQYLDVAGSEGGGKSQLLEIHSLKTGRLIEASVGVVLTLEGAEESARIAYEDFATELGVLFQIVDDILDVTGSDAELGKPSGSDERHGKLTYVSVYGLEEARSLAESSHSRALAALKRAEPATSDLESITDFLHTREN